MDILKSLLKKSDSKILLIVLDGIGDLPLKNGKTPLESAKTPNLDFLAKKSALGLHIPVDYGITPGSGPGHLGIFGYDPLKINIGRGVLEALGVGIELKETDVAIRGNFATVKYENGIPIVVDRRAGRIPTEENKRLINYLSSHISKIEDAQVILQSGREHRFVVVFRFPYKVSSEVETINDTDPQTIWKPPLKPEGKGEIAEKVSRIAETFSQKVAELLKNEPKANYALLRGFSVRPDLETFEEKFGLKACCIATYPMYKGLASLVGMKIINFEGETIKDEIETLKREWQNFDFFFLHIKKTDSAGEDGNFELKTKIIEEFDRFLPEILALNPSVLCITGDHSTPCILKAHSWHSVPVLIYSPYVLGGTSERFTEREALKGELGIFYAYKLMPLLLAHAGKLKKYGA
ncbi:phosphonopyruvate decarboxylase-related protein [Thermodesulfobacterium geofontis OPF15]|uniref:Probable 2,3-bisphosphoglycerate-independent phosphoglycerate mutase n=1 Tax=Thermodesulfobacterium geofontis (strain OPF15) TaxID=795359 RepID=F8C5H1_THEGP|nr:2,3-bisphosphoglycerate-independent phosphoglycerate mutase [Thermodesulfobacterium geofontis]AEH22948.1 phosphonopyruvate decarboxylase-related protein [Thermodesulfobacterium geofontis OPF15]